MCAASLELVVRIAEVDGDGAVLGPIYDGLLSRAFHPDELASLESMRAAVLAGRCVISAVLDDDAGPVAVAVGEWDGDSRVLLLSYLAVRPDHRSRGMGGLLMNEVRGSWQDRFHPEVTLAEIEHPLAHRASPDRGDPWARLRFYHRQGARALALPYFQPSLRPGAGRVYGMLLIALGPFPAEPPQPVVAAEPIRAFLTGYLVANEGSAGTDPAALLLRQAAERPGGIPLLPLDDTAALPLSRP